MRSTGSLLLAVLLVLALAPSAGADHDADEHSDNMRLVANYDDDGDYRAGSDLAFWGDTAVLGNYDNPGGFRLLDISHPASPEPISVFECPGPQNDVSIWGDLVFLSVDTPQEDEKCGSPAAPATQYAAGQAWEGIRIVSIADPNKPEQIAAVDTDCGSHTHTLVPDLDHRDALGRRDPRVLIYVSSYPLGGQGVECNAATHRKISVVEVPLRRPTEAAVVSQPNVSPAVGCHDITVLTEQDLAAAACITESQLWDISDPENPEILSRIHNPAMQIHHSSAFSWDGDVLVLGDEMGGAAAAAGCLTGGHAPTGSLWFFDISDREKPELQSSYTIPENEASMLCTAHNFNVVPVRSDRRILTTAWYTGGTHVLDFTDPVNVERIGHYTPKEDTPASAWSSYWYNDHIFTNNFDAGYVPPDPRSRGFDVFAIDHPDLHPRETLQLSRLNPQTQEPPRPAHGRSVAGLPAQGPPGTPPGRAR